MLCHTTVEIKVIIWSTLLWTFSLPGLDLPAIIHLGSYGALGGRKSIGRSTGSTEGRMGMGEPRDLGTKESQSRMAKIPSTSLATLR